MGDCTKEKLLAETRESDSQRNISQTHQVSEKHFFHHCMYEMYHFVNHRGKLGHYNIIYICIYICKKKIQTSYGNKKNKRKEKKKKTCTGLIQACIYMMRPEIITGTFQTVAAELTPICGLAAAAADTQ